MYIQNHFFIFFHGSTSLISSWALSILITSLHNFYNILVNTFSPQKSRSSQSVPTSQAGLLSCHLVFWHMGWPLRSSSWKMSSHHFALQDCILRPKTQTVQSLPSRNPWQWFCWPPSSLLWEMKALILSSLCPRWPPTTTSSLSLSLFTNAGLVGHFTALCSYVRNLPSTHSRNFLDCVLSDVLHFMQTSAKLNFTRTKSSYHETFPSGL